MASWRWHWLDIVVGLALDWPFLVAFGGRYGVGRGIKIVEVEVVLTFNLGEVGDGVGCGCDCCSMVDFSICIANGARHVDEVEAFCR